MVAIGMLMLLVGLFSLYKYFKKQQFNPESKLFHRAWMMMTPLGFIALLAGWFVTETGRQPWTVFGMLPTHLSASSVSASSVMASIIGFIVFYTGLLIVEMYLMFKYARLGPVTVDEAH